MTSIGFELSAGAGRLRKLMLCACDTNGCLQTGWPSSLAQDIAKMDESP
jgi:hypothetical protein